MIIAAVVLAAVSSLAAVQVEFQVSVELAACGTMTNYPYTSANTVGTVKSDAIGYFSDRPSCNIPTKACLYNGSTLLSDASLLSNYFTAPATVTLQLKECSAATPYLPTPIYNMWLLVKNDGSYCVLQSDNYPGVEAQKALCFPKKYNKTWVADKMLCKGYVYEGQVWACWTDLDDWMEAREGRTQPR